MRRSLLRSVPLAIAAIVTATGVLTAATPARAEFENERRLYLLMRVELENAQLMQRFFQEKEKAASRAGWEIMKEQSWRLFMAQCDKGIPGTAEKCRKIREGYQDAISNVSTLIRGFEAAAFFQSLEVDRLRDEFNTAVANYVTKVALHAAVLPPKQVRPSPHPPVRRRPANQRRAAAGTRHRSNDLDRILRETQRRLQGLQSLSR